MAAGIKCVKEQRRAQIGAFPIKKGHSKADIVRKLLNDAIRNKIKICLVLLDGEFFSAAAVIHVIKQNRDMFLMPARKKTSGIKKAIAEYVNGDRELISSYTIKSVSGHIESFIQVIIPILNAKKTNVADQYYIVFATNIPMNKIFWNLHTLPEEYRKGVELKQIMHV